MQNLFKYTNYRTYLKDYLEFKKKENPGFSLKVLSDKCGFKAKDFIPRVIAGARNLSKTGVYKTSQGLNLSEKEAQYFEDLVGFEQAKNQKEKEYFFKKIISYKSTGSAQLLLSEQFEYFSEWYHAALRSLLPVMNFSDNYSAIGKYLNPPIPSRKVKKSIELLIQLGLLQKVGKGKYKVGNSSIATGSDIKSTALSLFHKSMLMLASQSIDLQSNSIRDISGITLSVSSEGLKKIQAEILSFREKVLLISETDSNEDRVLQIGVQCFPLTKIGRVS